MGPESLLPISENTCPLDAASVESNIRQMLEEERESAERLQQVATKLMSAEGVQALYEQILDALQAITGAHFASIQMYYPERGAHGELRLLGHRGFNQQAAERWEW